VTEATPPVGAPAIVKPQCVEFVIPGWDAFGGGDPMFWLKGIPTRLEIERRFFTVE